jgi:hypothetical protein
MAEDDSGTLSFNEIGDIKKRLLLEEDDQTMSDDVIQEYLDEAHQEVFDSIGRNCEREVFYATEDRPDRFYTQLPIREIKRVIVGGTEVSSEDYEVIDENSGITFEPALYERIEVIYIPEMYVLFERAIAICNLMTRLNPTIGEATSTVYLNWSNKKKNYLKTLKNKFGVDSVDGF